MQDGLPPDPSASAAARWAPLARFIEAEGSLARRAQDNWATAALYEFLRFGVKQAWACLFGGIMVALLIATHLWYPRSALLPRYDFLVLAGLSVQVVLISARMETWEEAKVIFLFHVVGTVMEIFKTHVGSWAYPEASFLRIGGVPLFTGFMYASVGSYIARSWRLFDYRFTRHPPMWSVAVLALAIYANFFSNHWGLDPRWWLFAAALVIFGPAIIHYRVWHEHRRMPLLVACGLCAVFIWIAENVGTYTQAWLYPHQSAGWSPVGFAKFTSWYLLLIISYAMVAWVNRPEAMKRP